MTRLAGFAILKIPKKGFSGGRPQRSTGKTSIFCSVASMTLLAKTLDNGNYHLAAFPPDHDHLWPEPLAASWETFWSLCLPSW